MQWNQLNISTKKISEKISTNQYQILRMCEVNKRKEQFLSTKNQTQQAYNKQNTQKFFLNKQNRFLQTIKRNIENDQPSIK